MGSTWEDAWVLGGDEFMQASPPSGSLSPMLVGEPMRGMGEANTLVSAE